MLDEKCFIKYSCRPPSLQLASPCAVIVSFPMNFFTSKLLQDNNEGRWGGGRWWRERWKPQRSEETISFVLYWYSFPVCRPGPWQEVGRPMRKSRADGRVAHTVSQPSLFKTGSLNPSLDALQHSPACCAALCSSTIDEKVSDWNPVSTPFEWVFRFITQIILTYIQLSLNVTAVKQRWCRLHHVFHVSEIKSKSSSLVN